MRTVNHFACMQKTMRKSLKIALSVAVVTTVGVGAIQSAQARSAWNPMNWLSAAEESETNQVKAAQLKAEDARQKAQKAAEAAKRAEEAALQAKQAAEALTQERRPVASAPEVTKKPKKTEKVEKKAKVEKPKPKPVEKANKEDSKGGWHLLSVFDKSEDIKAEEAKDTTQMVKTGEAVAAAEPQRKQQVAVVETEKGNIAFELYPEEAPQTVENFVSLVEQGFYNKYNMKFHRVVPGFVIQTGDPTGTGAGGSKKTIPLEAKSKKLSHNAKGIVAMARGFDPNSASSQFYITLAPQPSLDGKYAVFGKVLSGLGVLDKIEVGDMLYGIRLVDKSSITPDPVEKKGFFSGLF